MAIVWLEGAVDDLNEIVDYIAARNPAASAKAAAALHDAAAHLDSHPQMGRRGRLGGTRELVVARFPFIIVYRTLRDRVEVLRVIHGRRDWHTALRGRT
jgi:addiction module RelE/StbE family toxin